MRLYEVYDVGKKMFDLIGWQVREETKFLSAVGSNVFPLKMIKMFNKYFIKTNASSYQLG